MELEPITRQEKIIAGQDLTPITRMEKFLKQYGGGGGGGGGGASSADVFIIHATPDETLTNFQLDKTTEQIYEAYQSGKYCLVSANGTFYPVTHVKSSSTGTNMRCGGFTFPAASQGQVVAIAFTTTDGVTWAARPLSLELYNVSFNGLQISGYGNRLYTISVDADGNLTATAVT